MQEISKFLVDNWKIILEVVLLIVSAVLFIVKKKPIQVVDGLKAFIINSLPFVINMVEQYCGGKGEEKLKEAVAMVHILLYQNFKLDDKEVSKYDSFIIDEIENILSTPQKKGETQCPKEK